MWYFLLLSCSQLLSAFGQSTILDAVQKLYLEQGLPYRENIFLDNKPILEEYDFVVIGSGPGGGTVASRLTEVPEWSVLVLELGPEPNIYSDIPFFNPISVLGNFSKFYHLERTGNACWGLDDGRCHWPAGEVVGGSSIINAMLYTRGHPTDFDAWADEGNPGWSYEDILPYFLKSENIQIQSLKNSQYHGKRGPVQIERPFQTKIGERFIRACQEFGLPLVDYNNPFTMYGISPSQATLKNGRRVSSLSAYLEPAKARPNFHVSKNTPAVQILIDPQTKVAYGVKYRRKGKERVVLARKEVILSAGSFNSAKLLMLSGVGHRDHLQQMGVPVIQDLPVGDTLQEHLGTLFATYLINSSESVLFPNILRNLPVHLIQWLSGQRGIMANNAAEALAYIKTPYALDKPDIELIFLPITPAADGGAALIKTISLKDELFQDLWGENLFKHGFVVCPLLMYPKSRGQIRLKSKDFDDPPIIDGNFFDHPQDVEVLIAGVREVQKLVKTKAFREVNTRLYPKPLKICAEYPFDSDEYWNCTIRAAPIQWHHQCGTCRMGPDPDSSVVDPKLRVHGVRGLRVVDASIIPLIPGPHIMAATYMIAEKASDLIKEEHLPELYKKGNNYY